MQHHCCGLLKLALWWYLKWVHMESATYCGHEWMCKIKIVSQKIVNHWELAFFFLNESGQLFGDWWWSNGADCRAIAAVIDRSFWRLEVFGHWRGRRHWFGVDTFCSSQELIDKRSNRIECLSWSSEQHLPWVCLNKRLVFERILFYWIHQNWTECFCCFFLKLTLKLILKLTIFW